MAEQEKQDFHKFQETAETYLQRNKIFDIFSSLSQKLAINKPKNALEFMISELEKDLSKRTGSLIRFF